MKGIGKHIIACVILILNLPGNLLGQVEERMAIFTDRNLYITGEHIHFSAIVIETGSILYCELITPMGNRIVSAKYQIGNGFSSGCLAIPGNLTTGNYYLRAYSRVGRNYGPYHYTYVLLKIINPYRSEVLRVENMMPDTSGRQTGDKGLDRAGVPVIRLEKDAYFPRDAGLITISKEMTGESLYRSFCLSVVPALSIIEGSPPVMPQDVMDTPYPIFQPEIQGMTLTGRILDKTTGLGVPVTKVNLSILGERDIISVMSDSSGHFCFNLPDLESSRDLFISPQEEYSEHYEILVDNDFCTLPVNMPAPVFQLSAEEKLLAYKMAVNQQISEHFQSPVDTISAGNNFAERSFYGEPSSTLIMEKYIQLPTLKDYFYELPTPVNIRKRQGQDYFRFTSAQAEMNIYDPLVLIDWVAIDDEEKILALPPQAISRIEFVNAPYVKGDQIFGGIINFISVKGDFAGIDLPTSGIFINFSFLAGGDNCEIRQSFAENAPDARNTVFWEPAVHFDENGEVEFQVTMPDTPGRYVIVLMGIDEEGRMIIAKQQFQVL